MSTAIIIAVLFYELIPNNYIKGTCLNIFVTFRVLYLNNDLLTN